MQREERKREMERVKLSLQKYHALLQERERLENDLTQKERLRALDHQIDMLGENHAHKLERHRQAHLASILMENEEAKNEYTQIEKRRTDLQKKQATVFATLSHIHPFGAALREGMRILSTRRSPLSMLFGRHPKVLLSFQIHQASLIAKQLVKKIAFPFLTKFIEEADKKWNPQLYAGTFISLYHEYCEIMNNLEEEKKKIDGELGELEEHFANWIEKH